MSTRYGLLLSSALLMLSPLASADATDTQADSSADVEQNGWMQGFPPPENRTIRFTDDDYFAPPKLGWTVCHFRELMPTAGVDNGTARPLATAP